MTQIRCDVVTLFPDLIHGVLGQSMLKRAQERGFLEVRVMNLRDYTDGRHQVADDAPYGGGAGMVMKAEPIFRAIETLRQAEQGPLRLILPSPQGRRFDQPLAQEFAAETRRLVFICGHYEGIDERVRLGLHPEEVSIGDYVLTGGELAALVMIEAAIRLVPGVLGDPGSAQAESFSDALLDYPHYTRPIEVRGLSVPDVLLSGNHEAIRRWRRRESLRSTYHKRPDLLKDRALSEEDRDLLADIMHEQTQSNTVECGEEGY